ncbi:MAG: hypothetical protein JXR88_17395 [Clostridia bacterium]|nr:hypothetical protein [Clostridia bacterium]
MQVNLQQYEIIEVFEENANQLVLLAVDNSQYEEIVIINKINKSNIIDEQFIKEYKLVANSLIQVGEEDELLIVVNAYKDSISLKDYLVQQRLDFNERIRLSKSFLSQISNYERFTPAMQNLFIHEDQLTIKNELLLFSDYIFLENYNHTSSKERVYSSIGHILDTILQLHRETITGEIASLKAFLTDLLENNVDFDCFNDVYNQFKVLASKIDSVDHDINYCDLSTIEDVEVQKIDLEYIKAKKKEKEVIYYEPSKEEIIEDSYEEPILILTDQTDEISGQDDLPTIQFDHEEDPFEDLALSLNDLDINPNFQDAFSGDDSIEDEEANSIESGILDAIKTLQNQPVEEYIPDMEPSTQEEKIVVESIVDDYDASFEDELNHLIPDDVFENWMNQEPQLVEIHDKVEAVEEELDTFETIKFDEELSTSELQLLNALDLEFDGTEEDLNNDELLVSPITIESIEENDFEDFSEEVYESLEVEELINTLEALSDDDKSVSEPESWSNKFTSEEPEVSISSQLDDLEEVIQSVKPKYNDNNELYGRVDENVVYPNFHPQEEHLITEDVSASDISFVKEPVDPLKTLLDQTEKTYNDLQISEDKKETSKTYYVPSFLAFFIALLIITSLLLYYTGTYI